MRDFPQIIDYDKDQLAYALANALKERDKAQEDATNYYAKIGELIEERDKAMETLREIAAADWKTSGELRGMAKKAIIVNDNQ